MYFLLCSLLIGFALATSTFNSTCPGIPAPKFSSSIAAGYRVTKLADALQWPRGVILDNHGHLLIVEFLKGITIHNLSPSGCLSDSSLLISDLNLDHGIYLTPDSRTLYASSVTTAFAWSYDPISGSIVGNISEPRVVVYNMTTFIDHPTRTLIIPKSHPNLLVVSSGSNENLDPGSLDLSLERGVVKVFDMNTVPSGGYDYIIEGWQAGWGLRNAVALVFDSDELLWTIDNGADDLNRTINNLTTDIHTNNPAESLYPLGSVTTPNLNFYGYPICFTVWDPEEIPAYSAEELETGDRFVLAPNSTFNDSSCAAISTPPRLGFQAHSAPLDAKFFSSGSELYVSFHGSWDREPPTGFKVVVVPWNRNGPVAPSSSMDGYQDVWWNTDIEACAAGGSGCFRPVGIAIDRLGRIFVTVDSTLDQSGELFILEKL